MLILRSWELEDAIILDLFITVVFILFVHLRLKIEFLLAALWVGRSARPPTKRGQNFAALFPMWRTLDTLSQPKVNYRKAPSPN